VTGADGFAGSHLCEALIEQGARVRGLVRTGYLKSLQNIKGVEIINGDMLDYQSLLNATKHTDTLFHLAAITLIPETRAMMTNTFAVNSMGTLNALMTAKENKVKKIVYASTCHVYGKQERFPISEEAIPQPIDIYSACKLTGEHLCTSFIHMFGLNISISRAFNHFGPRQREEFLIPTVITKLLRGNKLSLGNPEPTRDYTYISDIVEGYLLLAEHGEPGQIFQLCSGIERSVKSIIENIVQIGEFDTEIEWNPGTRLVDIPRSFGSYSKAKSELGWEPKVDFEEGVKKTIEWYDSRIKKH
jgi:dTDP-glucose 4,6-dehydratase